MCFMRRCGREPFRALVSLGLGSWGSLGRQFSAAVVAPSAEIDIACVGFGQVMTSGVTEVEGRQLNGLAEWVAEWVAKFHGDRTKTKLGLQSYR